MDARPIRGMVMGLKDRTDRRSKRLQFRKPQRRFEAVSFLIFMSIEFSGDSPSPVAARLTLPEGGCLSSNLSTLTLANER